MKSGRSIIVVLMIVSNLLVGVQTAQAASARTVVATLLGSVVCVAGVAAWGFKDGLEEVLDPNSETNKNKKPTAADAIFPLNILVGIIVGTVKSISNGGVAIVPCLVGAGTLGVATVK